MDRVLPYRTDRWITFLLATLALCIPLSAKLYFPRLGLELIFPAEPLAGFIALLIAITVVRRKPFIDRSFLVHPITLVVAAYIAVSCASAAFSTMPLVSWKAVIVRIVYITVFFFGMGAVSGKDMPTARRALWLYVLGMLAVALFSFAAQVEGGLDRASAGFTSHPFFADHTIYGAALVFALIIAATGAYAEFRQPTAQGKSYLMAVVALVMLCSLYLSFSRAAWLSVFAVALFVPVMIAFRRAPRTTGVLVAALLILGVMQGDRLAEGFTKSTTNSSAYRSGAYASLVSMANLSTDPSNLERLNRRSCAWRMFQDRPAAGFGPGTYQFRYPSYQRPEEMGILSVRDPTAFRLAYEILVGDRKVMFRPSALAVQHSGGSAHSEYFLAISETGVIGGIALLAFIVVIAAIGYRALRRDPRDHILLMAVLCMVAYGVHASVNNFLDDCKIAYPFWAMLALLTRRDVQRSLRS
jgi:putative inorganic carbon (hco3(-)) transporter